MASFKQTLSGHKAKKRRQKEKTFTHQTPDLREKKRIWIDNKTMIWIGVNENEAEAREKYLNDHKHYKSLYDTTITRAKKK